MAVEALEATGVAAVSGETDAEVVAVLVIGEVRIFFLQQSLYYLNSKMCIIVLSFCLLESLHISLLVIFCCF